MASQVQYSMVSTWPKNRSKYMVFLTIRQCSVEISGLVADLSFLLVNTPVPVSTLRYGLARWTQWRYLAVMPAGGYRLTAKSRHFLKVLDRFKPETTASWRLDIDRWRKLEKPIKNESGNWLSQVQLIKALEPLKLHRPGTPRKGKAGRPRLFNTCLVCGSKYRLDIPECPLCRMKAERAARVQQATLSPRPVVIKSEATVCRCPKCDGLCQFIAGSWVCPRCQITVWSTGMQGI